MSHAGRTTTEFMTTENPIQPQTKPEPQAPALRSGDLLAVFRMADKLADIHKTVSRFFGDKWPKRSAEIKELLGDLAKSEGKTPLAVAVQRAQLCKEPMSGLQILAAAYEMPSSANDQCSATRANDAGRST